MTQNQLRYWELRWKQHYESIYLEIQRQNADTERMKVQETARHNRREERFEQQRIIQENIKLSQKSIELAQTWKRIENETEQIVQNWAKIKETEKANMVHYAIEAFKADTERTKTQNQFLVDMGKLEVAQQETALAAIKASSENDREWFKEVVTMGQKAFGLQIEIPKDTPILGGSKLNTSPGGIITGFLFGAAQLVRKWLPNEYDKYQSNLDTIAKTTFENYGPQSATKIGDFVKKAYNYTDVDNSSITDSTKRATPSDATVTGFSGTESPQKSNGSDSPVVLGSTGSRYFSKHSDAGSTKESIQTGGDGSSPIIYSPGSHYGPGYV